ncbi:Cys-tRNA(Pro) deacylase [Sporolactobacillus terrae]|uniref:Cys-tRNA(Pro)/Cys-tRNA(Cys) deacylase n=1 Tax=Sporolactobacillus terrae TaxID=269673 RepID=A0ABX5QAV9_9BACL|nr:Cys-tRNA(Pro) deacylase [Sporolactobacillus terrae]QAA23759.1 Cys-tRNA(Pro) deacylase [Sporolactobacillus terrae]QAA26730.1 Cys-tRNA(Pro) deacylase [Sporolactobacillus terrae]
MGKSKSKTNAMRLLDSEGIPYQVQLYTISDGLIDGVSVAKKVGEDPQFVFKTLVTQGHSGEFYVFVVPVAEALNLKKAAATVSEKKVEMIHVKDIQKHTGYVRGGCSPIGMKKQYRTVIDASARALDHIIVSGGKKGTQIILTADDLIKAAHADLADITK